MEISFNNNKLKILYETGESKKYKLEKRVIESFFEVVAILEAAKDIYDLWKQPSLNFERLRNSEALYSVRLSHQYRLEISIDWTDDKKTAGILALEEISNHYGD